MIPSSSPVRAALTIVLVVCSVFSLAASAATPAAPSGDPATLYAETFDGHWEKLRDGYPYFELYGVDWEGERAHHRPRAIAAANDSEFAWELARLFAALPDPHVSFIPAMNTIMGKWSFPDIDTKEIGRRPYVLGWPEDVQIEIPPAFVDDPRAYPEITTVMGEPVVGTTEILAAGPLGSILTLGLRWPDGTETEHDLKRPDVSNLPPPSNHFGDKWLVTGRVGDFGYMRIRSFDPKMGTLGPDGKMTTMLRTELRELDDTDGLILDLQGNGGGLVAASDPFLGNLLKKSRTYTWGNSGGKRVIRPRIPRYKGEIVAIVDARSASGGEWAARILRDAGRATVVGGRTAGAEAAVHTSTGADGSVVNFSAWPMVEPGVKPFQHVGIDLDHSLPFTIEDVREHGIEAAMENVRRARFAKALEVLGAPASDLEAFIEIAKTADL